MGLAGVGIAATVASTAVGIGSQLAKKGAVSGGQAEANQAIGQGLGTATNQLSPWATTGQPANADQADLLGLNGQPAADAAMAKFQQSPGYAYQVQQGLRGVDAGAASQGILRSGATIKAEETLGSNLANQDFGNYWNRLQQLSSGGLSAATGIANASVGAGTQIANTDASAAQAQSNIYGNLGSGIGTGINQLANNNAVQQWLGGSGQGGSIYTDPGATTQVNPATGLSYQSSTNPALNWNIAPTAPS
jgi:hypothetical protein